MNSDLLTIHGSHDCSVSFIDKNDKLRIFELERFSRQRYCSFVDSFSSLSDLSSCDIKVKEDFLNYLKTHMKNEPKYILYSDLDTDSINLIKKFFKTSNFILMGHHMSHCASAFKQSQFKDALVFSLDGCGLDYENDNNMELRSYSVYSFKNDNITVISTTNQKNSLVFTPGLYGCIGFFISEVKKEVGRLGNSLLFSLSYAGKIMGLVAYGKVRDEWIKPLENYYKIHPKHVYNEVNWKSLINKLSSDMNINLYENCFSGQDSYDLAATNQYVFEKLSFSLMKPYIEEHNLDVVFSGGCSLNVLFNQKLKEYLNEKKLNLFVSPNPGDDGLSLGHFAFFSNIKDVPFSVYCGIDILDRDKIPYYYEKYNNENKVTYTSVQKIVDLIKDGKIGAIIQGYSEVGPRALGNRSIICDPSIPEMKDIINSKVKFREWFRPFAPVCREEDKDLYFENAFPSEYMSFAPRVKPQFREKLPSVTHKDGTARLQTVTRNQHQLFYDILTELNIRNDISVIMNTSFNIKGKPMLTRVEDAFYVLENTELDFIVVENLLFFK